MDKVLTDVDRYDLSKRKWDKLANLKEARKEASGTATHKKNFITGGWSEATSYFPYSPLTVNTCEVYNERTNEWQFIARSRLSPFGSMLCIGDKVYVVDNVWLNRGEIECYGPDKEKWNVVTIIPVPAVHGREVLNETSFSMRVFLGSNIQWSSRKCFALNKADNICEGR
ncbi:hypothetical protein ACROYT_G026585 [Oculina patagonica]